MRTRLIGGGLLFVVTAFLAGVLAHAQNQKPGSAPGKKPADAAAAPKTAPSKSTKTAVPEKDAAPEAEVESADEAAIRASAAQFTKLYNDHDPKGLAALFALKAEMIDEDGKLVKGREAIEAEFAQQFQNEPQCTMRVEVDSIRVLTPNIALEEGVARCAAAPESEEEITSYTCVHVKIDGKWQLASVSDIAAESEDLSPHEHLLELSWMIGDWVDESPDATVQSTCDWDDSGNFLLYHFAVHVTGEISMHGTTRVGWDAVRKQFRSWVFDSEGGFTEGLWIRQDEEWLVKSNGATPDGETCSSTNVYRIIDEDTFTFRSYDRIIDGELTDDIDEIVIKRRAPDPVE
jgi:uncharacterized protein (TIGR02246 family)